MTATRATLSRHFLAKLKARVSLVDLIGGSVPLRRAGADWKGLCPFHREKSPSFSVNESKGFYHCFGCGAHGDAVSFVMVLERRPFVEAVIALARRVGLETPNGLNPDASVQMRHAHVEQGASASIAASFAADSVDSDARRIDLAQTLWCLRREADASPVQDYLGRRGVAVDPPRTIGFLPGSSRHPAAMIAAFGRADEPEPGELVIARDVLVAVHLTRLGAGDGPRKRIIGRPRGAPIILAPMNDILGLAITEGVEDAISLHAATGLGAWAAGSAAMLPALADAVPEFVDTVTVAADSDTAGQQGAAKLAQRLRDRGLHVEIKVLGAGGEP